jgi:hypothetical protein
MCCSLWFLSYCLVLRVFSTVLHPTYKAGIEWCAAFVIPFIVFGLKSIFQQSYPIPTYKAGIEWCCSCDSFIVFGLRVFFNSPTHSHLKRDWVMCCSVIPFLCLVFFQQSYPTLPIKQDWVMCCSFVILSRLVLRVFFNSPTHPTYKAGIEWCAALCDSFTWS